MSITPLLGASWLAEDLKACIRQWIHDLNTSWNADGSLAQDEPMALANTVWGLSLLTQIQKVDPTLVPALAIARAASYLEREFAKKSHIERIGLIEWGLLAMMLSCLFQAKLYIADARQISNAYKDFTNKRETTAFRIVDALPRDCLEMIGSKHNIRFDRRPSQKA